MSAFASASEYSTARILVVDDEDRVREGLGWSLGMTGYQVESASSGPAALALLARGGFDLLLLDIAMPGMDGVEVMERARHLQPDLAVIVLTGHARLDSAIAAVKWGASDYLLKPVSIQNLQAAVGQALAARTEDLQRQQAVNLINQAAALLHPPVETVDRGEETPHLCAGDIALDVSKRLVEIRGEPLRRMELTEAETALLQELMRHPGQVRTCRQLVQAIWGYDVSEVEAAALVRSHIFRLRKKLDSDGDEQRIVTVRGGGYFLAQQ